MFCYADENRLVDTENVTVNVTLQRVSEDVPTVPTGKEIFDSICVKPS